MDDSDSDHIEMVVDDDDDDEEKEEEDMLFPESGKSYQEQENDLIDKFTPEAILEEGDQIIDFPFLDRQIKLEAPDNYGDGEPMPSCSFMDDLPGPSDTLPEDTSSTESVEDDNVLSVHMDIRHPLTKLRELLEDKIGESLDDFGFTLQDTQILEDDKSLVDQCMQAKGIVQINCELTNSDTYGRTINIVDVLRPDDDFFLENPASGSEGEGEMEEGETEEGGEEPATLPSEVTEVAAAAAEVPSGSSEGKVRWIIDKTFKHYQEENGIPLDPYLWSAAHVQEWMKWAMRQFNLQGIELSQWNITGAELVKLTQYEFKKKVGNDSQNSFFTHFELLRKCKIVAINPDSPDQCSSAARHFLLYQSRKRKIGTRLQSKIMKIHTSFPTTSSDNFRKDFDGMRPFPTGTLQLWQFLLDLLTDWHHRNAIQWVGTEGEFKLVNPELVAHLWGLRKNKSTMTYEKLSRALRYYYDGDMISKVQGKRYVYKFVCDLKLLMGYDAAELNRLVCEAEAKFKNTDTSVSGLFHITDDYTLVS